MAGTINEFIGSFKTDAARPSRFDVTIPIPVALGFYITDGRNLTMRCEAAQLPGRMFETAVKKMGSAPVERFPYHTNYNEVTLDFIVSGDMNEKIFFDAWMELVNPVTDYNFQYKGNYAVDISINQYDQSNSLTYSAVLHEAFPVDVNQMDLNWGSVDSFHKLSVVFVYKLWENNTVQNLLQQGRNYAVTGIVNDLSNVI